jgi:hypothetical protein
VVKPRENNDSIPNQPKANTSKRRLWDQVSTPKTGVGAPCISKNVMHKFQYHPQQHRW